MPSRAGNGKRARKRRCSQTNRPKHPQTPANAVRITLTAGFLLFNAVCDDNGAVLAGFAVGEMRTRVVVGDQVLIAGGFCFF
jgi:hypothetical protein